MTDAHRVLGSFADRRTDSAADGVAGVPGSCTRPTGLSAKRWCTALTVVAVILGVAATSASAAWQRFDASASRSNPGRISPTSAFVLPAAAVCVHGHSLTVRVRALPHVVWRAATVYVNGRKFKTLNRARITQLVTLTGLPNGKFALSITAITTDGRSVTLTRTYKPCKPPPPTTTHSLAVALAGTGSGKVTGSGISCPGACSHSYPAGTKVALTATPASGSSFTGWSGAGCSGTGTCTATMSSNRSVTATFTAKPPPPTYTLSVALTGTGAGSAHGLGHQLPGGLLGQLLSRHQCHADRHARIGLGASPGGRAQAVAAPVRAR